MNEYWDLISPYVSHLESFMGINAKNLGPLMHLVRSPVLVVGAGQGVLVEELRRKGLAVEGVDLSEQMVALAAQRRGIKLVHASAEDMPFEGGRFATSIVATGVVDYMEDDETIRSVIREVRRVTSDHGEILIALFSCTPRLEEFLRYCGVISNEDRYVVRLALAWTFGAEDRMAVIRNDPTKSMAGLMLRGVRAFLEDPKGFNESGRRQSALRKLIKRGELSVPPELLQTTLQPPYRNERRVRQLFDRLGIAPRDISALGNCNVVRL
jgi:SAM-dependent methyltransferase